MTSGVKDILNSDTGDQLDDDTKKVLKETVSSDMAEVGHEAAEVETEEKPLMASTKRRSRKRVGLKRKQDIV